MASERDNKAIEAARAARMRAHAPYSGKQVGAAIVGADGRIFAACNVENADSALRICAERAAVTQAVAAGLRNFELIVVVSPDGRFWPPCDLCRKVIEEFSTNPRLILVADSGRTHSAHLVDLPTLPFSADGSAPTT
jgi:cytidine deaminase